MLTKSTFRDFRVLADVTVPLSPLTVLVGPNGAGKSTVLDGLERLLRGLNSEHPVVADPSPYAGLFPEGLDAFLSRPAAERFSVRIETSDSLAIELHGSRASPEANLRVSVRLGTLTHGDVYQFPASGLRWDLELQRHGIPSALSSVVRLRLDPRRLAEPHVSTDEAPTIEADGEGLASVLQVAQGLRDGSLERIEATLRRIIPENRRIRVLPARVRRRLTERVGLDGQAQLITREVEQIGARFEIEFARYGWVPASALSEGTLYAVGLLAVLYHLTPKLLLIDDVDIALHPRAQHEVVRLLREVTEMDPSVQILCTTHSPFVVDAFSVSEVRVFGLGPDGYARCRPLSDHPAWNRRSGFLRPGEFWSSVGEEWVGNPPVASKVADGEP